jgi:hypothetical protein
VVLLAASSLALAPLPSFATTFTIGNSTSTSSATPPIVSGQSFTPNVGGNAADSNFTTVSGANPAQVYITNFTFTGFSGTAPATLNIYTDIGRTTLLTSSTSSSGFSYTFDGATALAFGTEYFALFPSNASGLGIPVANNNPYAGGQLGSAPATFDTTFTATFNAPVTAIPFEFSPTAGIALLGGLWGAKRLTKKYLAQRASKPSVEA